MAAVNRGQSGQNPQANRRFYSQEFIASRTSAFDQILTVPTEVNTPYARRLGEPLEKGNGRGQKTL
jgi:hypothetical protein